MIEFEVSGEPVAKGRPRVFGKVAVTPTKTVNYENLVKVMFMQQIKDKKPLEGALKVTMVLVFTIPKSASNKKKAEMIEGTIRPIKRPDIDNCIKAVTDALNGLAYKDDSQIVQIYCEKIYGEIPKVTVRIEEIK